MPDSANPDDDLPGEGLNEAEAALRAYGDALADAVDAVLPGWVVRSVRSRLSEPAPGTDVDARAMGERARAEIGPELRALLAVAIDRQRTNPLSILRAAVRYPTAVLKDAGVPPRHRDAFQAEAFPDDVYDLVPTSFADIDPSLHEPGLVWGAAKAYVHLARRRAEAAEETEE